MRNDRFSQPGKPMYWLVVSNRDTDQWAGLSWPVRTSPSEAIEDARRMIQEIGPEELRALIGDDAVTFRVDDDSRVKWEFVWSWTWDGSGPVGDDAAQRWE